MKCTFSLKLLTSIFLLCAIIQTTNSAKSRDFYKILGVKKSATKKEIKTAYRALAKQLHPDKNKDDPSAEGKFQDLSAAYEVLCDKEKRAKYNRGGEDALKDDGGGGGGGGFWPFGQQQREQGTPQGDKVKVVMDLSLEEVYNGEFIEFVRYKAVPKESAGKRECNCRYEMRQQRQGNRIQMYQAKVCDECNNVKLVLEERELEFEIEKGVPDGFDETTFYGEGEVEIDGDQGDLQIIYKVLKHERFERRGDDLYTNVTINLNDAMTGFKTNIVALDGRKIGIKREEITWPGMKMRVKGEGMPDYRDQTRKGNLIITFDVQFPRGKLDESSEGKMVDALKVLKYSGGKEGSGPILYNGLQGF